MWLPPIGGIPFLIGISMSAMAYRDEFLGGATGQKLSLGPAASDMLAKSAHAAVGPFQRPGPDILNEAIPVVFIGRNRDGFWVARDAGGKFGGLFWRKQSALRFAKRAAASTGCAAVFPQARFELDIENAGSRLIARAGSARLFLSRHMRQFTYAIQKMLGF
jgi:hypothetical protein